MNFLKKIFLSDIELLISDLKLIMDGYELNYIIDPYDFFEYCFPFGISFDIEKNLDQIGDENIAYTYLYKFYRPIILDEYKLELYLNRNRVISEIDTKLNENLLTSFLNKYNESNKLEQDVLLREIENSATFLLSSSLMTTSFIQKFDDLFFNRIQIDNFKLQKGSLDDEARILEYFNEIKRTDWSKIEFEIYSKKTIDNINKDYNDNKMANVFKRLQSTYRDFVVIDRICQINKKMQEEKALNGKNILLYFSSAKKSGKIFKKVRVRKHLANIEGQENYNILRSSKHTYLLFLIYDENYKIMLKNLLALKELAKKHKNNISILESLEEQGSDMLQKFENKINEIKRDYLEETSIENQIYKRSEYQLKIKNAIDRINKRKGDYKGLVKIYKELLVKAKAASSNIGLIEMDIAYSVQNKLSIILKRILEQRKANDSDTILLQEGKDLIQGKYHHLPILLFYNIDSQIDSALEKLFISVINIITEYHILKEKHLQNLFDTIENLYSVTEATSLLDSNFSSILVKTLIYQILPDAKSYTRSDLISYIRDFHVRLRLTNYEYKNWDNDYLYMLIWTMRRENRIVESYDLAKKAITKYPTDPRFKHGLTLALYNMYLSKNSLIFENLNYLEEILAISNATINAYKFQIRNNKIKKSYEKFVEFNIVSLYNLQIYVCSLFILGNLEKTNNDVESNIIATEIFTLKYLREELLDKKIKDFELSQRRSSKKFPEFNHTESVLELCEAIYYFKSKIVSNKIEESKICLSIAINLKPKSIIYQKTLKKVNLWLSKISEAGLLG